MSSTQLISAALYLTADLELAIAYLYAYIYDFPLKAMSWFNKLKVKQAVSGIWRP